MPRQQINLEPYREEIITLFQRGISSDSIGRILQSRRTTTADEVLHARIKVLFMQDKLTDKAMLKLLREDGYEISERTLRRLRFQLGLHARTPTFEHDRGMRPVSMPLSMTMSVPMIAAQNGQGL
ncbi:hypothetical protein POX_a00036 [Penicillium oxalicum]|uniref:hypothetical protein n=1 Tax=Penicillium oxalicum TaxID=69781 RepID=UPI0020B694DB|nr:hypothetical protein POX_a00036 [Penicillium oxalicum]KAI2793457.1 hypothetical protein POX_a00036 [Penicillium oxalicum]